jgi:SAM-dependent methyltransferase
MSAETGGGAGLDFAYVGAELDVFAHALNWKGYFARRLRPFLKGDVVEVGAGMGSITPHLRPMSPKGRWLCLEPDPALIRRARESGVERECRCEFASGTLAGLAPAERFDTIVYIDVLEHIERDAAELETAAAHLRPGGAICVLAPAHQWLYTKFDESIGHFRRYTKSSLAAVGPAGLRLARLEYLDCCGLAASAGNRFLLKSGMPNLRQILLWDRVLVRASKVVDPLIGRTLGKSVLAVWTKP